MNDVSLYEFTSSYKKQKINAKRQKQIKNCTFLTGHHQSTTQELVKVCTDVIPIVLCPSIPRQTDKEKSEEYAKIILLLFKNWRSVTELKDNGLSWEDSLKMFLSTASKSILKLIENIECLNKSKDDAEEEKKCITKPSNHMPRVSNEDSDDECICVDDNMDVNNETDEEGLDDQLNLINSNSYYLLLNVNNEQLNTPYISNGKSIIITIRSPNTRAEQNIQNFNSSLHATVSHSFNEQHSNSWQNKFKNINTMQADHDPFDLSGTCVSTTINSVTSTDFSILPSDLTHCASTEIEMTARVSYKEIIDKYSLNEKQQVAFYLFVEPLYDTEMILTNK